MEIGTQILTRDCSEILDKKVSYQNSAWATISRELTIREALIDIQSDKYKYQVLNLRNLLKNGNAEGYSTHKKNLSAITFCGTFEGERKKAKLKVYNSIIVLDIDKLSHIDLDRIKGLLQDDLNVFAFWESPSQEGLKGLVSLRYTFEFDHLTIDAIHKAAFQKLSKYFGDKYQIKLDISGSDTTRLCFFSYDPNLRLKKEINDFEITKNDLLVLDNINIQGKNKKVNFSLSNTRDKLFNPSNRNNQKDRYTIAAIIKFLVKNDYSITHSYEEWYKVAMAIANSFTYDIGEKYFLKLSSLDKDKFNEANCKSFLSNCYETRSGKIEFRTIVYYATRKGFIIKKQRDRGSEAVDENLSQVSSS